MTIRLTPVERAVAASMAAVRPSLVALDASVDGKAPAVHVHVSTDITDFDEAVAAIAGEGGSGLTHPQVLARSLGC